MVKNWKAALIEASDLSGWDSMVTRPEAKLIDEIVKDILKNLNYISPSSDFEGLVGLNSRIERIKSLLCIKSPDFRIVGIWGMGGIGKTTIAGAIFEKLSHKFEGKCFMANVRQESERGGLIHLREQVLSQLLEENLKIETPNIPQYIKERLQEMKVCIVLDDVNKFSQLEYLAGGLNRFGSGSRIIITTRDKQVLDKFGVDYIYEVEGLNHEEALELFCNYAFRKNHCPQDLMMLSKMVVNYAEGNPLALKVLGSSLYRKSKQDWDNALNNLKQISNPDIYDVLKISYSELNWEEKNIFLDIACFFKGEDRNHVTTILSDSYLVHYGLNVLIDKSLITVSGNKLQMHDLLQEMGQEIVRQESYKEPGKRSRLWHYEDVYHVLKKNKGTDSIEGMFLDMSKIRDINLSSKAFVNMSNLRLLKFYVPGFSDISNMVSKVHLPQGLEYLTDELRYLHWHGYPLKTLPSNFSPENLIVLGLPYSEVEKLWIGEKEALKLKLIDLHHSRNFLRIPGPLETPNLERINLSSCTNLHCIPSSIQNFSELSILDLQGCESFRCFPNDSHFGSSIILDFSNCVNLTEFPHISGNIKELHLCGTAIEEVPSSIECLTKLIALNMGHCTKLKSLSTSICKLRSLQWINLDDCWGLESFPEISEKMECLEYISLASTTINVLPSSSDHLEGQRILGLSNGSMLDNLSKNLGNVRHRGLALPPLPGLSSLTRLNLSYRKIINIPPDIGCLSKLRSLDLRGNNFESLPTSVKQLSRLKYLMLSNCHKLQSLPVLPVLSLNYLEVMNCKQLQSMPGLSSCLDELDASELETLSKCCSGFSRTVIQNIVRFMFTNCLKLNKKACNSSLADSQLRIQNMATTSLRLFYERKLNAPPGVSICLPGSQIPNWFTYKSSESSITIQLPLALV
ncbi:Disease resistance protein (TIR-NBS-LRR class) family [Melia azedarach]|uniref:Disease resistance protein (TIR-NBS-LRR class) family n=1 Tax=Melia azedarach TaxID=155640 RepID=A0ACC1YJS2_MELAZ|nr:Disease resistance protein (TIR-NBS-LRR class) family [Melia azedarach]